MSNTVRLSEFTRSELIEALEDTNVLNTVLETEMDAAQNLRIYAQEAQAYIERLQKRIDQLALDLEKAELKVLQVQQENLIMKCALVDWDAAREELLK